MSNETTGIITKAEVVEAIGEVQGSGRSEGHGVSSRIVSVTPDMALKWLENDRNPANRSVNQDRVRQYSNEMRAGRWRVNNQGIAIGKNGELYDGQHRLWAVVEAELAVVMLVVSGLPEGVRTTIDRARPRKTGDDLSMMFGIARGHRVATCLNYVRRLVGGNMSAGALTTGEALEALDRYGPGIQWSVALFGPNRHLDKGIVEAPFAYAYKTNPEVVSQLAESVKTGAGLGLDSPAYAIRNWVVERLPFHKEDSRTSMLKILAAIHTEIDGERLKTLRPSPAALRFFAKAHNEVRKLGAEEETAS